MNLKIDQYLVVALLATTLVACGEDTETEHEDDLAADTCIHLQEATSVPVSASAEQASAPAASELHTRYELELGAVDGGNGGFVQVAVAEAGHLAFALGRDVPLSVVDASGTVLTPHETLTEQHCAELARIDVYELGIGTVFLSFGPSTETSLSMVIVAEGHEHEHEHE